MTTFEHIKDVAQVILNSSDLSESLGHDPSEATLEFVRDAKILVIGAGGLGCEILKDLALSGFTKISVIDMDTIDVTNLNRQFLFRAADVGKPKACVAADFINNRFGHLGVSVTPYVGMIQNYSPDFYANFFMVITGLDNIAARRWINSLLFDLLVRNPATGEVDPSSIRFLLDGGTEGLKGQARVIIPSMTSCFECTLDSFPPQTNFPICTIAETPRQPEHCIEYALLILWPRAFGEDAKPNFDSSTDVTWIFEQAAERAKAFGIGGVTYQLTLGVVKRIIPAVASTNATIAGVLVLEALKITTYCNPVLNNYLMYMGQTGLYTHTFEMDKKAGCLVCGGELKRVVVSKSDTLQEVLKKMVDDFRLTSPSLSGGSKVLYMQKPESLRKLHEYKLGMTVKRLIEAGELSMEELLTVTDPVLSGKLVVQLVFH